MVNSLEERLKTHSSAFDGLLSLIPAKYYYDDSTKDQWKQKKKSKQEFKQNKRTKLNPETKIDSAKDISDLRAQEANEIELPKKLPKPITEDSEDEDVEIPDMDVSEEEEEEEEEEDIMNDNQLIFDDDGNEVETESFPKQEIQQNKKTKTLSPEDKQKRDENLSKLREKLTNKINNLKEKRKAIGTKVNGAPQSREQILAERKRKEELKKRKHQELEQESDESDNEMSSSDDEEEEPEKSENSVLFGNIVFEDGSQVTSDLSKFRNSAEKKKQKGPANNDLKAHLLKLEAKKKRLSAMTPEQQLKQQEKDKWQKVLAQAEGIKVKDDEKLLKKAIKRKEKQKLKSEIEWKERKQVVKDTVAAKAKRREENLKARRDNKGKKGKKQPKLKKFTGIVNKNAQSKKKRAGFEGSAKSKFKK